MTPAEMVAACAEALKAAEGTDRPAEVTFVMRKGGVPRTFPRGELLCERRVVSGVERVYRYRAERVLDWMARHGLAHVKRISSIKGGTLVEISAEGAQRATRPLP